jgi:hypothetical protein
MKRSLQAKSVKAGYVRQCGSKVRGWSCVANSTTKGREHESEIKGEKGRKTRQCMKKQGQEGLRSNLREES